MCRHWADIFSLSMKSVVYMNLNNCAMHCTVVSWSDVSKRCNAWLSDRSILCRHSADLRASSAATDWHWTAPCVVVSTSLSYWHLELEYVLNVNCYAWGLFRFAVIFFHICSIIAWEFALRFFLPVVNLVILCAFVMSSGIFFTLFRIKWKCESSIIIVIYLIHKIEAECQCHFDECINITVALWPHKSLEVYFLIRIVAI